MVGAQIPHFEMSWSAASTYVLGEFNSHTSPKLGVVLLTQILTLALRAICNIEIFLYYSIIR